LVINRGKVKVHLSGILRFELTYLEFHDHVASQVDVIKEEIEVMVLATYR
jgi:hypothetical protein